jgi:outer membrane protein assembly factor BamB
MRLRPLIVLAAWISAVVAARAGDWPQWRGPDRDDVSKETGLLQSWPEAGPKLLWTFRDAGVGYSGPAVVGALLYMMGAEEKTEYLYALDTKTLKKAWRAEIGPMFTNGEGDGPRGTPTVDGDRVYGLGAQGEMICADADSGSVIWRRNLKSDLGGEMWSEWGYSESPLVDGDQLVCTPGGKNGAMAALDKMTGVVRWRSKDWTDKAAYSSVVASEAAHVRQYVQMTGESVAGIAADDGRLLWRCDRNSSTAPVPTPIVDGDRVYVTSGYTAGCALLGLAAKDKGFVCTVLHKNQNLVNHHGGVLLTGGYVYGYDDSCGLVCQDFQTTEVVWDQKSCKSLWDRDHNRGKFGKMSVTCADGQLYCYGEDAGKVLLIAASPKGLKENGRFDIPERTKLKRKSGKIWTHPVVAAGKLFLRDQDLIFCYDVKDAGR